MNIQGRANLFAIVLALMLGATAWASLSDTVFTIQATNAAGSASFSARMIDGRWHYAEYGAGCMGYDWNCRGAVELRDSHSNMVIARLNSASVSIAADPQVTLGFAVQAGDDGPTDFTITSALLSFPTIPAAQALASAQFQITDTFGDDATLTPIGTGAYITKYNGFFPGGTAFAEFMTSMTAGEFESSSQFLNVPGSGYTPVAGAVSDMCARIKFTLSASDLASGTTNYEIVPIPEPATALLLLLGLGLVRRR